MNRDELREALAKDLHRMFRGSVAGWDECERHLQDEYLADADALLDGPLAGLVAVHNAVTTIKATGGAVEINGVRIEPCDEYGTTATTTERDALRAEVAKAEGRLGAVRGLADDPISADVMWPDDEGDMSLETFDVVTLAGCGTVRDEPSITQTRALALAEHINGRTA